LPSGDSNLLAAGSYNGNPAWSLRMARHLSFVIGHLSFVCVGLLLVLSTFDLRPSTFAAEVASPLSPADAQKQFVLADTTLAIELAAAEPEVIDPVAIRFDEDGRMWVAEMRDYPLGPPDADASGGRHTSHIRVLEDRDGDGRFETATTFADKLSFVTGLQPWKGGVFVTLAGAVVYMKDTDGDGRCDLDETWYEGFAEQNTQLRANHPRLALDNHIYVANGLRGGKIVNRRLADQPVIDISGMDFRFDPLTGQAEAVSGNGQFGLCFDDWGNRFTCSNRNPVRHVVIEDRYLRASPGVTVPSVMHDVAAFAENSRIFPISRAWTTSNLHAGQFTAACGVYIYRGDLLPAEFKSNAFTCDPTGNLIHREIMQPAGPTFTSKPAYDGKEFLASPDEWFRPVNMELGPDGALYVVDMYRCVIEHPDFVPDELKKRPDLRLGDDRGRIWRIVAKVRPAGPAGPAPETTRERANTTNPKRQRGSPAESLSTASSADLVELLAHPNAWQRETAQRLLIEREWRPVGTALSKVAQECPLPQARVHAWVLLQALGQFDESVWRKAFADSNPHVRKSSLKLVESQSTMVVLPLLSAALHDEDPGVRFQARLLGALAMPNATNRMSLDHGLDGIVEADTEDIWLRRGVVLFLGPQGCGEFIGKLLGTPSLRRSSSSTFAQFAAELAELGAGSEGGLAREFSLKTASLLQKNPALGLPALQGALRGLARNRVALTETLSREKLAELRQDIVKLATDSTKQTERRRSAVDLLGFLPDAVDVLIPLVQRDQDQSIRTAAITALARQPGAEHWQPLIDGFASDTPAARRAILEGLLSNRDRTKLLLDAIEAGQIKPSELDVAHTKRLTESRDGTIKERAGKLFAAATPAERAQALAEYQVTLEMKADAQRGSAIFEKHCAACHKIGTLGVNVAPDISDSRTKTAAQLLGDIILPNRAIDNNYLGYSVRLADGEVAAGILTSETGTSITLRQQGGKDLVLARSEIAELKSSGVSLMPEGMERQIPPQDMADLISFIKNWRYLDGKTPLTTPADSSTPK
jgi:putative membrane-bound dehydrogenase-like protein